MTKILPPILSAAKDRPESDAIATRDRVYSYSDLVSRVAAAAEALRRRGVDGGSRIAFTVSRSPEAVILLHAMWQVGAVPLLLSRRWPLDLAGTYARYVSATHILSPDTQPITVTDTVSINQGDLVDFNPAASVPALVSRPSDGRPATMILTSGSSGDHKMVVHSLGNHVASALAANDRVAFGPGDRWLLSLPLNHVGGLGILFRAAMSGGSIAIGDSDTDLADNIDHLKPTHLSLVSTQLRRLLAAGLEARVISGLKAVLVGGGPIPSDLIELASSDGWPVLPTYGCTEMASQVATAPGGNLDARPNSCGPVLPHCELRLSADDEILVRGRSLCLGYQTGDERQPASDDNGWYHTGDIGSLDESGNLTVLGRKDDMFISGGENIHPAQIEAALLGHPDICEVVVVSIEDDEFGHRPVAVVRCASTSSAGREQLAAFLSPRLPYYMLPVAYMKWPESGSGPGLKPGRANLQDQVVSGKLNRLG